MSEETVVSETPSDVDSAHHLKELIVQGFEGFESGAHNAYRVLGGMLCSMRDGKKYKHLGYKNIDEFIRDIGRSRTICYNMMDYNEIIVPLLGKYPNLTKIPITTIVKDVIPLLRQDKFGNVAENIDNIATLPDSDMRDELRRMRGKVAHVDCKHEDYEGWIKCKLCGKFIRWVEEAVI